MPLEQNARVRATALAGCLATSAITMGCGHASSTTHPPPMPSGAGESVAEAPAAPSVPPEVARLAQGAVAFDDLGSLHREISTRSSEAQDFFDQGLRLTYGFNHDEAARSFAHAAELDPSCAMCFWGVAYTLGPNYNVPMLPDRAAAAWAALEAARASEHVTPVERALIDALAARYVGPEYLDPVAMQPHTEAYAAAMREVARRFPDDDDVQTLFAEALMDVRPWRLWEPNGTPAEGTQEIVSTLETVLARNADHPGANHYYIHAVEASPEPARGIAAADRLPSLVPGAGHVVHMPAHIYQRVGRYEDASEANRRAVAVDRRYLERVTPPGYYGMYVGHNFGFLAYSASMEGRKEESLAASREATAALPRDVICHMPGMDFFLSEPLLVMVRFGLWDAILAEPEPDERYPVLRALYRHAHGMALVGKGRVDEARADLESVRAIETSLPADLVAGLNVGRNVLALAAKVLEARIAEHARDPSATRLYEEAVAMEDALAYAEPADWFYPVRHLQGAWLLDQRKPREAEAVFRADLVRNPENGWALLGLRDALRAQRKRAEADAVEARFRAAFAHADIAPTRAAYR